MSEGAIRQRRPSREIVKQDRLDQIAADLRKELVAGEEQYRKAIDHALRVGELLNEAHSLVARGLWGKWLAANFEGSQTVASTYMRLAQHRVEIADARTISAAVAQLAPSATAISLDERNHEADPMAGYRRASSAVARALAHAGDWMPEHNELPPGYLPVPELRARVERLLAIIRRWEGDHEQGEEAS